jgi:Flp pilus assembly protein CpaB
VSRRGRAIAFFAAAGLAAAAAATIADGYGDSVARGYGALRSVVVARSDLRDSEMIDPRVASSDLEVRQVPLRFVPPAALANPSEAIGLVSTVPVPSGSYLLATQLHPPRAHRVPGLAPGRQPVEITVSGAGALSAYGSQPVGSKVDVAVTTEGSGPAEAETHIAAISVPLLALGAGAEGVAGEASVTLALTRAQALRLLAAEGSARRITVIPAG